MRIIAVISCDVLFSIFTNAQSKPKINIPQHRTDSVDFRDASKTNDSLINVTRRVRKNSLQPDDSDPKKPKQKVQMK